MTTYIIRYIYIIVAWLAISGYAKAQTDTNAYTYNAKGNELFRGSRYSEALSSYTKGLEKARTEKNNKMVIATLGNIGNIYAKMGDFTRALYYQKQGYAKAAETGDNELQNKFATNLVGLYCILNDVKNAKLFYKIQMTHPRKDLTENRYYAFYNQGVIAQAERQYAVAEYSHRNAMQYAIDSKLNYKYVFTQWTELGKVYLAMGRMAEALKAIHNAFELAVTDNDAELKAGASRQLSDIYAKLGDRKKAEIYKGMYLALSDSIFNDQQLKIANGKLFEYENRINKEQVDQLLRTNWIKTLTITFILILLAIITALTVFIFYKNKRLLNTQKMLITKNMEMQKRDVQTNKLLQQYANAVSERDSLSNSITNGRSEPTRHQNNIGINEEQINLLLEKISTVMSNIQYISQPDFSIDNLVELVGSNKRYVSWVINDRYGKNFRTLLNEKRIDEACIRLTDTEHYGNITIRGIYEELGFNSPTSFNNAFKKAMGMTPSAYQRLRMQTDCENNDSQKDNDEI